ncbi:NUDIX domain-containing protein [Enterococcus asini]|uniref:NUDIX domain-containing protein n=1 Tax=Enterococcus asini TaxID=57732 RepID=UPI00288DC161|nr:NUDIX domain-containing protein [Enterococcus asini]MDT2755784.1 NUDIX domain-containing protein [Enterococcus asini]
MVRDFSVELTTICMIENAQGEILVQDRQKTDWPGWTFPGGHVEKDESLKQAMIREIHEECGLTIQPTLMGIGEWRNDKEGNRELAGLFYAQVDAIATEVSDHGEAQFWVAKSELHPDKLAGTLGKVLPIFLGETADKTFYQDNAK